MHREFRLQRRFDDCKHYGHVFRTAARHHGADRDFFDRAFREVGRDQADNLIRLSRRAGQHPRDPEIRRRDGRQTVRPAPVVGDLHRVFHLRNFDGARHQMHAAELKRQAFRHAGF